MYEVIWDTETGGILLQQVGAEGLSTPVRPVFHEELDLLGFQAKWRYPRSKAPLLWATTVGRRYFFRGEAVAEAKGGSFFHPPTIQYFREDLELTPIDVPRMLAKNCTLMRNLAHEAIAFIRQAHDQNMRRAEIAAVAFSGGKDSLVLLDLVHRALRPDEFVVVFNDTQMEITPTYEAVKKAEETWPHLRFRTSRSHKSVEQTWREFGPPSRIHRWCCTVHKSVPNLLLLRQLAGNPAARALIYDGIRWEESQARAGYQRVTYGGKHGTQINVSPIVKWNSAEVFLYLLTRNIFLNEGYRYGFARIGCAVCPFASQWWNALVWMKYPKDCLPFLDILSEYALKHYKDTKEFLTSGAWKGRAGGRFIDEQPRLTERKLNNKLEYIVTNPQLHFTELINTFNIVSKDSDGHILMMINSSYVKLKTFKDKGSLIVHIFNYNIYDRYTLNLIKGLLNKLTYCVSCKACEVECPKGAIRIGNKTYVVDHNKCVHCLNCITFVEKGCYVAKSLQITNEENTSMKGINRYQHFGMKKEWLHEFFLDPAKWFVINNLGNRQFEAMKVWLRESEIIVRTDLSDCGHILRRIGLENELTWYVIWIHLARNSKLINWYINNIEWNTFYSKKDMIQMLGDSLSVASRDNAIKALFGLFKDTPLGESLNLGIVTKLDSRSSIIIRKSRHEDTDSIAILYSMYRYAEKNDRYEFSISDVYNGSEGVYSLFGLPKDTFTKILIGLSTKYNTFLSVEIVRDLDNIYLFRQFSAIDILRRCSNV